MSIDEAIVQLEFNDKKGAKIMKEVRHRLASGASVISTCRTPDVRHYAQSACVCPFSGSPGSSGNGR